MKYVSADALLKAVERYFTGALTASEREKILAGVPTIDIVFCKECKYWHDHITTTWCSRGAELRPQECGWVKRDADDYCNYGERKEGE